MEENASNALMMAGSVLIGLIVVSAFVGLFVSFTNSSMKIEERLAETQLKEFNAHYEIFTSSDSDEINGDFTSRVTIYDIVSLINFTKQYNHDVYTDEECKNYNQDSMPYYVVVEINFGSLRAKNEAVKNKTSPGFNPYQEASKDALDVFLRNCYYGGGEVTEWEENEDYIYKFECTGIEYNPVTARVTKISFEFVKESWF